jgi:3-isopropylmalate/(R)-2-methylmalate dehydratase small subunit
LFRSLWSPRYRAACETCATKNGEAMQPFSKHTGLVLPLDRVNVDTDQMVPKQFLKLQTKQGYGRVLFYDWRYLSGDKPNSDFVLNWPRYKGASILLARAGFGCGSSREHAPWAIADYGFRVILAPGYADIFYSNCFINGILPITLPEAQIDELFRRTEAQEGFQLTVDLPAQSIADAGGVSYRFEIDEFRKHILLEGLDEIGITLKSMARIAEYEKSHRPSATLYAPVDAKYSAQK